MRSTKFLAALCIAAMFASCAKDEFVQDNAILNEAYVGAELVGSNISMDFGTNSDTKLSAEGWELNDKLGLAWIVSGTAGSAQSTSAAPAGEVYANHMFQKAGSDFTTKGNVYKGWHFAYYPFGYMETPAVKQTVTLNPVQEDKMAVDYYKNGLYVSARDFLTAENHLNDNNELENVKFDMWRVSNFINVEVEPSVAFTGHNDLKGLAFQKMVLTTNAQAFLPKTGVVTLNAENLPAAVYDKVEKELVYNSEKTIKALKESLPNVLGGTLSSKSVTTEVKNSEINLSGNQEIRVNTLAVPAGLTMDAAKVNFVFYVEGGRFDVKYTSEKALADLDENAAAVAEYNNDAIEALVKAYKAKGDMTVYGKNLKLNLKLTAEMFTPDFSSISDIDEWNQAVKVANALNIEDPTFVVDGDVKIGSTFTLPNNGLVVETTGAKGCLTVNADYTMEETLAVALDKADVLKVAKNVALTIPDNMAVYASIENKGTINVGVKAEIDEVNNASGRINVVYGSYVTVVSGKDGVIAYEVLPYGQETPARVNTLIKGGTNGKHACVNTLVINDGITFDMNMTKTNASEDDPYYNAVVDRYELTDLSKISIEMNGGEIIADASLTESVKKIDVLAGENKVLDLNVETNLTVKEAAKVTVDATIHKFGKTTYKKDVNVKGDVVNAGVLTANTNINVKNIDNESGKTVVNDDYTIWYTNAYVQGGIAEGKILKYTPVSEKSVDVETAAQLTSALGDKTVTTIVLKDNSLLTGTIDLKGKTLKAVTGKNLVISNDAVIKNGTIVSRVQVHAPSKANKVTLENITLNVAGLTAQMYALQWQSAESVTLKGCKFNTTGRPFESATGANTQVVIDGCLFMNTVGTNNPYINPVGSTGKVTIKDSNFEVALSCEVEGKESKFEVTGNVFEKHFGTAVADGIKSATRTFLNGVLDNNTFNGNDKIAIYDIALAEEKFYSTKF